MRPLLGIAILAGLLAMGTGPAKASTYNFGYIPQECDPQTYCPPAETVSFNSSYAINALYEYSLGGFLAPYSINAPPYLWTFDAGSNTITNLPPEPLLFIGVTGPFQGEPAYEDHLVLFTNVTAAAELVGNSFSDAFNPPGVDPEQCYFTLECAGLLEDPMLSDLLNFQTQNLDFFVNCFETSDCQGVDPYNGLPLAPTAVGNLFVNPNSAFDLVAFSTGQIIGTGVTETGSMSSAPEPATWAIMITGLGALGGTLRVIRRRKAEPCLHG